MLLSVLILIFRLCILFLQGGSAVDRLALLWSQRCLVFQLCAGEASADVNSVIHPSPVLVLGGAQVSCEPPLEAAEGDFGRLLGALLPDRDHRDKELAVSLRWVIRGF